MSVELDTIYEGDCLSVLRSWPDGFVHCVVTSPPYWGLRDYGTATWEGGAAWVRVVKSEIASYTGGHKGRGFIGLDGPANMQKMRPARMKSTTLGWRPSCICQAGEPEPCIVLDPFMGAGTVGLVARKLGRRYLGIELNPEYISMAQERIRKETELPLFDPISEDQ